MKQTGNSAQAARAEMDHAQAELMEILWKKEQAAKKAGKRWTATDNKKAADQAGGTYTVPNRSALTVQNRVIHRDDWYNKGQKW